MEIVIALLKAFLVGGLICIVGQLLLDFTKLTPGKILVGFVVLGVILGAAGIYKPLIDWAGCGASIPLTGFGANLVEGTKKAIAEEGWLGVIDGPLKSASVGIMSAVFCGLVVSLVARPKDKE